MRENTQNGTYITIRIHKLTKQYITIRIHNLQNYTEAYKICNNDTKQNQKNVEKNVINESAI